jgi:hypothetical protein
MVQGESSMKTTEHENKMKKPGGHICTESGTIAEEHSFAEKQIGTRFDGGGTTEHRGTRTVREGYKKGLNINH